MYLLISTWWYDSYIYLLPVGLHKCGRSSLQTSFWWPHSCWWTTDSYLHWHTHTDHVNAIWQISPTDHLRKWTRRFPWSTTKPDGVKPKNAAFPDTSCIKQRKNKLRTQWVYLCSYVFHTTFVYFCLFPGWTSEFAMEKSLIKCVWYWPYKGVDQLRTSPKS